MKAAVRLAAVSMRIIAGTDRTTVARPRMTRPFGVLCFRRSDTRPPAVTPIQPPTATPMPINAPTRVGLASKLRIKSGAVQNARPLVTKDRLAKPTLLYMKARLPRMQPKVVGSR